MNKGVFAAALCAAWLVVACGETVYPRAAQSAATKKLWEGIGAWSPEAETRPIDSIVGVIVDTPLLRTVSDSLAYEIVSVEDLSRGIARAWPSIDHRWIALRVKISHESVHAPEFDADTRVDGSSDTLMTPTPFTDTRSVILGEIVLMRDNEGGLHFPSEVHNRIIPNIHEPIMIPREGLSVAIIYALRRNLFPVGAEIHDPLRIARLDWRFPEVSSGWRQISRKVRGDERVRRFWDVSLVRIRMDGAETEKEFRAELTFRNISSDTIPPPNANAARLYLGSGRTLTHGAGDPAGSPGDTAQTSVPPGVGPNRVHDLSLAFAAVPLLESLELVIPYQGGLIRSVAWPGFYPETVAPLFHAAASGGLNISIYNFSDTGGEFAVRIGALNEGAADLSSSSMRVVGLMESNKRSGSPASEHHGEIDAPPSTLYMGFEERRWVRFDRRLDGVRVEIPARDPVVIWF